MGRGLPSFAPKSGGGALIKQRRHLFGIKYQSLSWDHLQCPY